MQKKILMTVLLLLVLCLLSMYVFLIGPMRASLYEQCYALLSDSASVIASGCSELFSSVEKTSYSVFWFDEVFDMLIQDNTQTHQNDYYDTVAQVELLTGRILPDHRVLSVGVYDASGILRTEAISVLNSDAQQEAPWLEKAKEAAGGCIWTPVYTSSTLRDMEVPLQLISMYRALTNPDTFQYEGTLRITVAASNFMELFSEYKSEAYLSTYLLDADGTIMVASAPDATGMLDMPEGVMLEDLVEDMTLARSLNMVVQPLEDSGRYVVIRFEQEYYLAQLPLVNTIQMILALICSILLALSIIGSFRLSRPARQLKEKMEQVAAGDLSVRAKNTSGTDEISVLAAQFNRLMDTMQRTMDQLDEARTKELEIRMEALQAQINPHFLFNTLDNMRWMSLKHGDEETAEYMVTFSRLLHRSVNFTPFSLLEDEIQFAQDYIDLEKNRFGDRLDYHLEIEDQSLLHLPVPTYFLQPMLENSIVHGFLDKTTTHTIFVAIAAEDDTLTIDISDNGVGSDQAQEIQKIIDGKKPQAHIMAMKNLAERIRLYFGENTNWDVRFYSEVNMGARILITLPASREAYAKHLS